MIIIHIFFKTLQLVVLTIFTVAWSFYLGVYVRAAYSSKSLLLDSQTDLISAGALFILIFGSISLVISYKMLTTGDLTKTQLAIILISAVAFSSIFHIAVSQRYIV